MNILLQPWFPPLVLVFGLVIVFKSRAATSRILGSVITVIGILLTAFEIWGFSRRPPHL